VLDVVARKNSRDLQTLADDFDRTAKSADDFGNKLNKTSTFSKYLDEQLVKTKAHVRELGTEFDKTGKADVFANLKGAERNLKSLEGIKKQLATALAQGGQDGAKDVSAAVQGGLSTPALGPILIGSLVAAAVAAAPLVGAALGGAVSGAFALGGVFAGAFTELKTNPQVQAAGKDFLAWLGTEWKSGASAFAGPLMDAFALLKTDLAGPLDDLKKDFAYLAPYAREFAMYIGAAAEKFMPGFNRMIQSSGPILTELGHGLVYVADGLNVMFDEISKGGKGEVEALDVTFRVLGGTLAAVGFFVRAMANSFDWITQVEAKVTDFQQSVFGWIPLLGDYFRKAHEIWFGISNSFDDAGPAVGRMLPPLNSVTVAADNQKKAVDDLKKSWDDYLGIAQSTDQAELTLARDTLALKAALAQNKGQWDLNTRAGQDHRAALQGVLADAKAVYDAQVKQYGDNPKFLKAYQDTIEKRLAEARATGAAADYVEHLRIEYLGLVNALNFINGKVVHYSIIGTRSSPGGERGFYQGLAHGGRADAPGYAYGGGVIKVGEQGPEYLSLPPMAGPAYVTPNSAINGAANSSARAAPWQVECRVTGGGGIATLIQSAVRSGEIQLFVDGTPVTVYA
jgi:hypothetical protein